MALIFSLNPGATSTKCALYQNDKELFRDEVRHDRKDLDKFKTLKDQLPMRFDAMIDALVSRGYKVEDLDVVVARGGILPPVDAGAILVTDEMVDYLLNKSTVSHPANLAAAMALEIVKKNGHGIAYVYDPISVDQLKPVARISGLKDYDRGSTGHMLNSRAAALQYAHDNRLAYDSLYLIVVHAGTGITVTAHEKGRMIDIVGDDEGAFSPERTGGLPLRAFTKLCYTKTEEEVVKMTRHHGGLMSYFDTNDVREVESLIPENPDATVILEAMAYQIAKSIGQMATVLKGQVDGIVISGGFARSQMIMEWVIERVQFISDVTLYPGEFELEALSLGGYRAYLGQEPVQTIIFDD